MDFEFDKNKTLGPERDWVSQLSDNAGHLDLSYYTAPYQ